MSEDFMNQPAYRLAYALESIRRLDEEFAEQRREHKDCREKLLAEIQKMKMDILTGQKQLPLEPVTTVSVGYTNESGEKFFNDPIPVKEFQERLQAIVTDIPHILDAERSDEPDYTQ